MAPMQSAQGSKSDFDVITFWYAELMMRESSYDPVSKLALESFSARLISPSILSVISTVAREAVVLLPFNTVTLLARVTVTLLYDNIYLFRVLKRLEPHRKSQSDQSKHRSLISEEVSDIILVCLVLIDRKRSLMLILKFLSTKSYFSNWSTAQTVTYG